MEPIPGSARNYEYVPYQFRGNGRAACLVTLIRRCPKCRSRMMRDAGHPKTGAWCDRCGYRPEEK